MLHRRIRSVEPEEEEKNYNKINRDLFEVVENYKKYTTPKEWQFYLAVPFSISIVVFLFIGYFEKSNMKILTAILDMNQISLNIMAILAGFNTTCLSIIAASNNQILRFLQSKKLESSAKNDESILKQIVSFFSFSIIYQIILLLLGIVLVMVSKNLKQFSELFAFLQGMPVKIPLVIIGILWLAAIIFALVISLRNATLLYRYVLFVADYQDEE